MKTLLSTLLLLSCYIAAFAQSRITVSGYIRDGKTGEALISASIAVREQAGIGTVSNEYGFYSLTLEKGSHTLVVSFTGYEPTSISTESGEARTKDILLYPSNALQEVTVRARAKNYNITRAQMGVEKLTTAEIKAIPVLFGEKDILKALQLLPGVKAAGDGNSGFYVRGGGADQNLVLLDEAIVYNPSHLLGFFSTFNSDAIKDVTLYKCAMPAQYGGRLSSVEDIRMNDGNKKNYGVSGGIGLISSRLNVEGPLGSEKGSFLVTGRRTYADAVAKLWPTKNVSDATLYFYDFNLKANYKLSEKDRIYLSGYFGKDKLGFKNDFGLDWSNTTATLRWNHLISNKLFSNASFIYSDYNYNINIATGGADFGIKSEIRDWNLKEELSLYSSPRTSYHFGLNAIHHTITPGVISNVSTGYVLAFQERRSLEGAVYFSGNLKASAKLNIDYGVRVSSYAALGAGNYYNLDANHNIADTMSYSNGQIAKSYVVPEPRLSISYLLTPTSSIKGSYARNAQYLHLISNSTSSSPTDKWIPSNNIIKPGISDQVSLGYYQNFTDGKYEFSAETYYKTSQNEVDYKDGADVFTNDAIETQLLFGKGRAYGLELLMKKKTGRLTGWVGYTLSKSELQIDGINHNNWYSARQDRTHDISVVGIYQLTKKWNVSSTFVYSTGNAVSFPSGKYNAAGNTVFYYTERNGYRVPAYHRLDLAATKELAHRKHFSSELSIGIYNAYGHENPYTISFRQNADNPERTEAVQTTLFKIVPSISYNFKF
ncbi:MAG: TonB-dependent receptor [Chitinophagaceae bacterium]